MWATAPGDPVRVDREAERVVEPAERREPRLVLESGVEVVDAQAVLAEEVDERSRVDGARAGGHRHALERGEAHRRVDRAPVEHGGHRAAAAQVADDDPRGVELRDDRLHGDPVEPVAAHAPVAPAPAGSRTSTPRWGSSRGTPCRRPRRAARPGARARASRIARSAGALWSGAMRDSSSIASSTRSSISTGSVYRAPPCTTR